MKSIFVLIKGCKVADLKNKLKEKLEGVVSMNLPDTIFEVYIEREKAKEIGICLQCFEAITTWDEAYLFEDDVTIHGDCLRDYAERFRMKY